MLLPAVAAVARGLRRAALMVFCDECRTLPVCAKLSRVLKDVGLATKVLPVVRVDALGLVVLSIERAPLSFEVEHPEVGVALHIVDQSRLQLLCRVRKTAVVSILASGGDAVGPVRILGLCAVFAFVFLRMVD